MIKLNSRLRQILGTQGQRKPSTFNSPLFITGCMRSGTTFLVDSLSSHPQLLKVGVELNDVWTEIGGAPCMAKCPRRDDSHVDVSYAHKMAHYFFENIQASKTLKAHCMRAHRKFYSKNEKVFYDWDNIIPMNKSPHLTNKIPYVHALFPDSKVILIVRNIFEQCSSLKKHIEKWHAKDGRYYVVPEDEKDCWSVKKAITPGEQAYPGNIKALAQMWINLNTQAITDIQNLPTAQGMLVDYADIHENQSLFFEQIFSFLNLNKRHKKEEQALATRQKKVINTETSGDPRQKYLRDLSQEEIDQIELVIRENQKKYDQIMSALTRNGS